MIILITDPADPRVRDYASLTDVAYRTRVEPGAGLYLAESAKVIRRAVDAGHRPRSLLMAPKWLEPMRDVIERFGADGGDVPVYVADEAVLEGVTGYHVHRGAIGSMERPKLLPVADLLRTARGGEPARRVLVLEDIVDHTNVGAAMRSAAALGVDAVLVTPRCADPLYRRAVRVSMGTVFQTPWTRLETWPGGLAELQAEGYTVAALALSDDSISLDELAENPPEKLALVLGTEGDGLARRTVAGADVVVRIPMEHGVDSLNVAAAGAVAIYATRMVP